VVAPLRKGVYLLPNLCTTAALLCGFYSVILTLGGRYLFAAVAVLLAQVLDALDGRVARMTKTTSNFGVQYDSLSDLVSFGVAPGILVYRWALEPWGAWGWFAASLYVVCGALRLARFNVQVGVVERRSFVGLPVPAAASLLAAIILLYHFLGSETASHRHVVMLVVTYVLALLMVSNIRYYSFKDFQLHRRQPFWILVLGIIAIELLMARPQVMLFVIFTVYVASGPARWAWRCLRGTAPRPESGAVPAAPRPEEATLRVVRPQALDTKRETSL
jgi:CDP-diacylglycerol--serine O-phosphatidyltransferase